MSDTRNAGKRGRLPQREPGNRFFIRYAHEYASLGASVPSYPVDVSKGITDWGMDGNDTYGDCGPAAVAHERMLGGAFPTAQEVEDLYFQYTGGQDVGVVLADFLLWLFQQKLIEGFAPVQPQNIDAIMGQFGRGVLLGVSLTDDANDLFNESKPWTTAGGERPDPNEGHAILKVKSDKAGGTGTIVTWGADQVCTGDWLAACVDEAWVLLTKDDLGDSAYAALLSDLLALPDVTANPPVAPPPTPPTPTPVPPLPPGPAQLRADLDALLKSGHGAAEVRKWIETATAIILAGGA